MSRAPVRRSQLIAPFGVGAMMVSPDRISLIGAGLDHWYERENYAPGINLEEFRIQEWRLEQELEVDYFRLPPDHRRARYGEVVPNTDLTVPFLRFPRWHVCPRCKRLDERGLDERSRIRCRYCEAEGHRRVLYQVPFIAMCDQGHIQDFPFREWVHRTATPHCKGTMWLYATGGASLGGQRVKCECGVERSLFGITNVYNQGEETYLTNELENGIKYTCAGRMPWLGTDSPAAECGRPLRGSLRSASNVYFPQTRSAIYLPRRGSSANSELVALLERPPLGTLIRLLHRNGVDIEPTTLQQQQSQLLSRFSDEEIRDAVELVISGTSQKAREPRDEDPEVAFRRPEYEALRRSRNEPELLIRAADLSSYDSDVSQYLARLTLVDKLKETRAFTGFTRVTSQSIVSNEVQLDKLWRTVPLGDTWLPAYVVHGEGIYLELCEPLLRAWERRADVVTRVEPLIQRYEEVRAKRGLRDQPPTARLVLLHTLAHLLMLRLTFECGYGTASMRERLYVSSDPMEPMAGLLIYTADGDSEGTMGGLVRMGRSDRLTPVFRRVLEAASWCSNDPICMEVGRSGGQGPDSLNLAACHSCALLPETACEQFNHFLDRGLLIGEPENPELGFFCELVSAPA